MILPAIKTLIFMYLRSFFISFILFSFVSLISIFLINTVPGAILGQTVIHIFFWLKSGPGDSLHIDFHDITAAFNVATLAIFIGLLIYQSFTKRVSTYNLSRRFWRGLFIILLMFLATAATVPLMPLAPGTTAADMLMMVVVFALVGMIAYALVMGLNWLEINMINKIDLTHDV